MGIVRSWNAGTLGVALLLGLLVMGTPTQTRAESAFAGEFLTLGVGGRALALGGGYAALASDATAAYWNPAGLGQLSKAEAAFMHSTLSGLDSYDYFNLARPFGPSVWSLSWLRVGIDDIALTSVPDPSGPVSSANRPIVLERGSVSNNAFVLAWGRRILTSEGTVPRGGLYAGLAGKFLFMTAPGGTNAFGFGGDAGLLGVWRLGSSRRLRAGISAQDFFRTNLYWNTVPEPGEPSHRDTILPNVRMAAAVVQTVPPGDSELTLTAETSSKYRFEMHYGAEWNIANTLALRLGLQERKSTADTLRDLTAGVGFRLGFTGGQSFAVDYAFADGDLGGSHRVSMAMRF